MVCFFRNPTDAHYFIVMIFFYAKRKSLIIESCLVATETFVLMEIFSLKVNCCLPKTGKLSLSNERKSCPLFSMRVLVEVVYKNRCLQVLFNRSPSHISLSSNALCDESTSSPYINLNMRLDFDAWRTQRQVELVRSLLCVKNFS